VRFKGSWWRLNTPVDISKGEEGSGILLLCGGSVWYACDGGAALGFAGFAFGFTFRVDKMGCKRVDGLGDCVLRACEKKA